MVERVESFPALSERVRGWLMFFQMVREMFREATGKSLRLGKGKNNRLEILECAQRL